MQSEEIVAQLVYGFLIPDVHKVTARERGGFFLPEQETCLLLFKRNMKVKQAQAEL